MIVETYSQVEASQVFWMEVENLLITKSADFKNPENAQLLKQVVEGVRSRTNETFWKVFTGIVQVHFDAYSQSDLISLLHSIDNWNGRELFELFKAKHLSGEIKVK